MAITRWKELFRWCSTTPAVVLNSANHAPEQWWSPALQVVSTRANIQFLAVLHRNGVPEWFGYSKLEFSANVAMFIPLGFLVTLLLPTRVWWLALVICPALSIAIELTQGAVLSERFSSGTDVLSNSLGAIIGILIAVSLRAIVYQRDEKVVARALWDNTSRQRQAVR